MIRITKAHRIINKQMMLYMIVIKKKQPNHTTNKLELRWCYMIGGVKNSGKTSGSASIMIISVQGKVSTIPNTSNQYKNSSALVAQ